MGNTRSQENNWRNNFITSQLLSLSTLSFQPFSDALQEFFHAAVNNRGWCVLIGNPYKAYEKALVGGNGSHQRLFLMAVSLAYLALQAVAVDGMLEALFGHADEHLCFHASLLAGHESVNYPQRVGHQGFAAAAKQQVYQPCADNVLSLRECGHLSDE